MTIEEAIKILERIKKDYGYDSEKAISMAIRSLECWEKCRQDIISFINTLKAEHYDYNVALDILEIINENLMEGE